MPNGIRIFFDENRADAPGRYTITGGSPLRLAFKVFVPDPFFSNYTELSWCREDSILYLDNSRAITGEAGKIRLHGEDYVSPADFITLDSPLLENLLDRRDRLVRPVCVISLHLTPNEVGKNCFIRFKARETFWKYYLLGSMAGKNVFITDRDNAIEFECIGEETLPDERLAKVFRSTSSIPLQQNPEFCFQLREKRAGSERYLIKRLPVASVERIDREMINGKEAAVSKIFINY